MGRLSAKRPGRLRRYVLRPLIWSLALLALAVFLGQLWLDAPPARAWAKRQIEERASAALGGRAVTVDDIAFELLPLTVQLYGLEIAGERPPSAEGGADTAPPALLRLPYVLLEADLFALERRRLHLRLIRVERPRVDLRFFTGGGDNIIRGGGGGRRFELLIDRVEVVRGELELDHGRIPLQLDAETLRTELRGLGERRLEGRLAARNVRIELPSARPIRASVVVDGGVDADRLWVDRATVAGQDLGGVVSGGCEWPRREDRKCTFATRGAVGGVVLDRLGYFGDLRGEVEVDGTFGWRPGSVGWSGRVAADRVELWDRTLRNLAGDLAADRYSVRLDLERARYADGLLGGTVHAAVRRPGHPITADLRLEGLDLDALLADQQIPIDGFASRVSGSVLYRCPLRLCRAGDGRAELTLRPDAEAFDGDPSVPAGPANRRGLPLGGQFPLRVESGVIYAEAADVMNDRQSLLLTGSFDLPALTGRFDYQIETADVGELVPLLPLGTVPDYLPTAGAGHLEGSLLVRDGRVWTSLEADLEQVATPRTPPIARVEGGLDVTPWAIENIRLTMADVPRGRALDADAAGDSTVDLVGRLPYDGVAELHIDAVRVPMDLVRPWAPVPVAIEGQATGRLELELDLTSAVDSEPAAAPDSDRPASAESGAGGGDPDAGDPDAPAPGVDRGVNRGRLIGIVAPARLAGLEVDGVQAEMTWDGGAVRFDDLTVLTAAGPIAAAGGFDWDTGALDLALSADGLDLARRPFVDHLPRRDLAGEVALDGRLGGVLENPRLELTVAATQLEADGRRLDGATRLDLDWRDRTLRVGGSLLGVADVRGGGRLDRQRADLGLQIVADDLAELARLVETGGPHPGGELVGRLQISGELDDLSARLLVERLAVELDERRLESQGVATVAIGAGGLQVAGLRLLEGESGSELALSGVAGWDQSLDFALVASLDLGWLGAVMPDVDIAGQLELDGQLLGSLGDPEVLGTGRLEGGRLALPGLTESFSDLRGLVRFEGERARVEQVRGRFAGGEASLSGLVDLELPEDGGLPDHRLQLVGRDLAFAYLDGWAIEGDVDLSLRSAEEGQVLAGSAQLERLEYLEDIRFDVGSLLRDALRGQRLRVEPAGGARSQVQLEVQVQAPGAVRVRNNLADLRGDADFTLRGTLAQPVIFGEIEMLPGGRLEYNETDYELDRGRLTFADPYRLLPEVDIEASTRVRDIDVKLALSGSAERLEARFSSEPPLPEVEVFRLLAGGDAFLEEDADLVAERTAQLGEDPGTSAATFLYGQAATVLGRRVNDLFRFDRFRIDPLTGADDNLSKARVTLGKRLSKDVFVTYSVDPSSTDNQRIQVEWQVGDGLVLVLTQNGDNTFSADARWETSF